MSYEIDFDEMIQIKINDVSIKRLISYSLTTAGNDTVFNISVWISQKDQELCNIETGEKVKVDITYLPTYFVSKLEGSVKEIKLSQAAAGANRYPIVSLSVFCAKQKWKLEQLKE